MKKYKVEGPNKEILIKKVAQKLKVKPTEISYEILKETKDRVTLNVWVDSDKPTQLKKKTEEDLVKLDVNNEGVYLTVEPGKIEMDVIINKISKREVESPDMKKIQAAYDNRGKPYKIGEFYDDVYKKSTMEVNISKDKMQAYMTITPPVGMNPLTMKEIKERLAEDGIEFGFKINTIKNVLLNGIYNQEFVVAAGEKPVNGSNGYVNYKIKTAAKKKNLVPAVLENGKVDFKNLEIVENVKKDQVLAEKIPPTPGKNGKNILGKEIIAKNGKDVVLYGGKNTEMIEDDKKLISQIDGMVNITDKKIEVSKVFETPSVGISTGNIDFIGAVNVTGDVMSDHKVTAGGNITVKGNVECAELYSKADIIIKGSMFGKDKAKVIANNDVILNFAEATFIEAGDSVIANEALMNCTVNAAKKVRVIDKKGVILGGKIKAGEGIEAINIGSHLAVKTSIEVGSNPKLIKEIKEYEEKLKEMKKKKYQIDKNVLLLNNMVSKLGKNMPADKLQLLQQLTSAKYSLETEIEISEESIEFKTQEMEEIKNAIVEVHGICYPGVKIKIRKGTYIVKEKIQNAKFFYEDGEVKFNALK